MKTKSIFAVVYMFAVTALFSALIIGFSRGTAGMVEANEQISFEKAVLDAFPEIEYASDQEAHKIFQERFEERPEAAGALVYLKDGKPAGYAVPIAGEGFWAEIRGVVGVDEDLQTLRGIGFYEQNETPGLGARILEPQFRRQFDGLELRKGDQPIEMRPPGAELSQGQVHAISGATQTCMRLEVLINEGLREWRSRMGGKEQMQ